MSEQFLYLNRADIAATSLSEGQTLEVIGEAFKAHAAGLNQALPKSSLDIAPGHAFQALCASAPADNVAGVKWLGAVPVPLATATPDTLPAQPSVQAIICLNDLQTGALLAVMDGDLITLRRTAAMSVLAAAYLGATQPRAIGFIACGAQALAHLHAFSARYDSLREVFAFSRRSASANALVTQAQALGYEASVGSAREVLAQCDIVVTTVPNVQGFTPFLDASWLKPGAFVAAVDLGRSWMSSGIDQFDILATDSLSQWRYPYAADGTPLKRAFDIDLAQLVSGALRPAPQARTMFNFRGYAIADLAVAALLYREAIAQGRGTWLAR